MHLIDLPISQIPAFDRRLSKEYYGRYARSQMLQDKKPQNQEIAPILFPSISKEDAKGRTKYDILAKANEYLDRHQNSFADLEKENPGSTWMIAHYAFRCEMDQKTDFARGQIGAVAAQEANLPEIEGHMAQLALNDLPINPDSLEKKIIERHESMFTISDLPISDEEAIERGRYAFGYGWKQNLSATKLKSLALSGILWTQEPTHRRAPFGAVALCTAMRFKETFPKKYQNIMEATLDSRLNTTPANMEGLSQPQKIYLYNTMGNIDDDLLCDEQKALKTFVLASAISMSDEPMESYDIDDAKRYLGELKENAGRLPLVQRAYIGIIEHRINALKELPPPIVD